MTSANGVRAPKTLRTPPFAREVLARRRRGLSPTNCLWIGAGWDYGRAGGSWRIVVPPTEIPLDLDFTCVAGLDCLLLGDGRDRLDVIASAIIPFRPARLIGVTRSPPATVIYKTELAMSGRT